MGANFGDVDNDGYPDIYFGTGELSFASLLPNVLLHNKGGKKFVDITTSSGTGELHKGHGVAFADIDNDGDEDLLEVVGGGVPGDTHTFRLFENPGHGNDWIGVRLVGVKANRAAIGARVKVTVKNGTETRAVYRTVGSGGSFGASPLEQHMGLGKSAEILGLEIQWPGDAQPQRFASVPKNKAIEIRQFASDYRVIERPRFKLGGNHVRAQGQIERGLRRGYSSCFWLPLSLAAATRYPVTGIVLKIDRPHRSFDASCAAIPGYMEAMAMPYSVLDNRELADLKPGAYVDFTLVVEKERSYAEGIHIHRYESSEREPLLARRLKLLEAPHATVKPGDAVPDFTLIDQTGRRVTLSQWAGKVVAVTFIYTSCPLPDYCFRLANNFGQLNQRFAGRMGRDLVLLSISFDPVHDQPKILAKYASTWKADPESWHFLTGPLDEVKAVSRRFGLNFWPDDVYVTHSLHTLVIDRRGRLAADFEGNQFTARQLGDYVEVLISGR